jgi:hypothetical protein
MQAIRLRAVLLALAIIPLNAYWIALTEMVWSSLHFTAASLPLNVVFILCCVIGCNALLRRWSPRAGLSRAGLSPADLLIVYIILATASAISGYDSLVGLVGVLPHATRFATVENDWTALFRSHLPDWLTLVDDKAVRAFYAGEAPFLGGGYWRAWVGPMAYWGAFLTLLAGLSLCITVLLRRPWTEHEKLAYPIIQLPMELSRRKTALFRGRLFWVGFGIAAVVDMLNGLNYLYPAVPSVPVRGTQLETYVSEKPWSAIGRTPVRFRFFMVGMTYLLPLDLSVSCWAFYWIRKAEQVVGAAAGLARLPGYPFLGQQAMGGMLGLGIVALVAIRRHLAAAFRSVTRRDAPASDGEPITYRAAVVGGACCAVGMAWFSLRMGLSPWVMVAFAAVFWTMYVGMARIRAEAGVPEHDLNFLSPQESLVAVFGTRAVGPRSLSAMSLFVWFSRRKRNYLMPHQLEAFKIAERERLPNRAVFGVLLLATVAGLVSAMVIFPGVLYRYGAESRAYGMKDVGWNTYNRLASWLLAPRETDWAATCFLGGGFVMSALLMFLRHRFVWWPLHPAGFVLGTGFGIDDYWFAMVLSSCAKFVVLRSGGVGAYRRSLPFFFGLILGDYLLACGWALLGVILDAPMYTMWQ